MKLETLKKDNKKKIAIGIIAVISITLVGVFATTFAKYKLTESIPLAEGMINYKAYDFKIMAMYQQKENSNCTEDNCYNEIVTMPESGYAINESKSYCTIDNKNKDTKAILKTENGKHIISSLSKSDKCYLYFDKDEKSISIGEAANHILSELNDPIPDFSQIATRNGGLFKSNDDDGITYYYRGAVENNYLTFAGFWWRIIRINGDGTIRIIYDGTVYHANGTKTADSQIGTSKFNSSYQNAMYVGFKYGTTSEGRGLTNKSSILTALETWYTNNLASYVSKIDINAGFCGDRTAYVNSSGTTSAPGYGTSNQYFEDYVRLMANRAPVLTCADNADLYTTSGASKGNKALDYPIGLINANEVSMAGGLADHLNGTNTSYYLRNGYNYWTMSPYNCNSGTTYSRVFYMDGAGYLHNSVVTSELGVRPVINLKSDVPIIGTGTQNDPYVVS